MTPSDWELAAAAAVAAGVLVNGGAAKLVSPGQLRQAVAEVAGLRGWQPGAALVRLLGAAELAAGAALVIAQARLAAAIVTTALGACFAVTGALGLARGASVPCGCFGSGGVHPLGWLNIWLGAGLVLAWPVVAAAGPVPAAGYSQAAAPLAAIAVVGVCLWLHRAHIMRLRRAPDAATANSGVS